MQPQISIIGLHLVQLTKSALVNHANFLFGEGNVYLDDLVEDMSDAAFAERFADLYLIEIRVDQPDSAFDPGKLGQASPALSPDFWQVAYDEKFLNDAGTEALDGRPSNSSLRLGFFLHSVDLREPLSTPYGLVRLPAPTRMPQRLAKLFRYVPP